MEAKDIFLKQGPRTRTEEKACLQILSVLSSGSIVTQREIESLKARVCEEYGLNTISNISLLAVAQKHQIVLPEETRKILTKRPVRSLSGIVNVSVLTKPYPCPAPCAFCPLAEGFPKSYLPGEPAADRAKALNFDPFLQVYKRLETLALEGHNPSKIELRVIGGTWSFYPKRYQTWFIKNCFDGATLFGAKKRRLSKSLLEAQKRNEKAEHKIVGISIETRPDFITLEEVWRLRKLGVTLVEMGVQALDDELLQKNLVGTNVRIIAEATQFLKDFGFKVLYQVMPQLPFSNKERDRRALERLWEPDFSPDWLKIYPCTAIEGTLAYKWYQEGRWRPYSLEELIQLLVEFKKTVPPWVRITRIFRDIPPQLIKSDIKVLNLRQILQERLKKEGASCSCIRCREPREKFLPVENLEMVIREYEASKGKEWFLSWEDKKREHLVSFVRLRRPSFFGKRAPLKVLEGAFLIREVQTFGLQVPPKTKIEKALQHKGLARKLIKRAEEIAKKEGAKRMVVISGVGVRDYYRKLGYRLQDTYMVKRL